MQLIGLQELKLKHEAKKEHKLQEEYDKIKFRLKCMDIELHTEVWSAATI